MESWFITNKLSLNTGKTSYTNFDSKLKVANDLNLLINGQQIAQVSSSKYLGVIIDQSLIGLNILILFIKNLLSF